MKRPAGFRNKHRFNPAADVPAPELKPPLTVDWEKMWAHALLQDGKTDEERARQTAAAISPRQYRQLCNTVKVLRMAGVRLDAGQERSVKLFETTIREYQRIHGGSE